MVATPSQSLPVPSVNAIVSTNSPISSVRFSFQAAMGWRLGASGSASGSWCSETSAGRKSCVAHGTPTPTMTAITNRCGVTGTSSAFMAAPISAPATVPMLNPAWKRDMIDRPSCCSTAAASTFWATSQNPLPNPSSRNPAPTTYTLTSTPSAAMATPTWQMIAVTTMVRVTPKRCTIVPDSGNEMSEPMAIISSSRPSGPGVRSSSSRNCGMRDSRLAMPRPHRMKTRETARVALTSTRPTLPRLVRA